MARNRSPSTATAIYEALKSGTVDAQENPLALVDLFKLYEVVSYVSMTNHMWSGFNLLAHQADLDASAGRHPAIIERNVREARPAAARDQETMNTRLRADLARRGLVFNDVDAGGVPETAGRRLRRRGRNRLGSKCWSLLNLQA